jgi:hypothetical protein
MKQYHYQETLIINVTVFANSKKEAQDKVATALGVALNTGGNLDQIDQDIRESSFDTLDLNVCEEN